MRTRAMRRAAARDAWDRLSVSFWFAPAVMAVAALLLSWATYRLDSRIPNEALQSSRLILSGDAAELRTMLVSAQCW